MFFVKFEEQGETVTWFRRINTAGEPHYTLVWDRFGRAEPGEGYTTLQSVEMAKANGLIRVDYEGDEEPDELCVLLALTDLLGETS